MHCECSIMAPKTASEPTSPERPRVVVTNLGSDRNKGDSAILSCLLGNLCRHTPGVDISLISSFGWDDRRLESEYFHTRSVLQPGHRILGSVFPIVPLERSAPGSDAGHPRARGGLPEAVLYTVRAALAALRFPLPGRLFTPAERQTLEAFRRADLVISNGGGFVFGERGLRATVRLFRVLFPCLLARAYGVPFVLYGQSFGPFAGRFQARLARRALDAAAAVLAREEVSCRVLREIGVKSPVRAVPDLAFGLAPAPAREALSFLRGLGLEDGQVLAGMTVRNWRFQTRDRACRAHRLETYVASMAAAIEAVHEESGAHWVLWPQCTGFTPYEDDRLLSEKVREACRNPQAVTVVKEEMSPALLKACYGQMELFVATRFHSAIFALTGFVPTLAVGYWGPKATGIMGGFGLEEHLLPIEDISPEASAAGALRLWHEREKIRAHLHSRVPDVAEAARRLDFAVAELMRARRSDGGTGL